MFEKQPLSQFKGPSQYTVLHVHQARQNKPINSGGNLGLVCGNFLSGALTSAYGWEIVFYVLGLLLVIWFCFWSFLCYNEPSAHPRISKVRMEQRS